MRKALTERELVNRRSLRSLTSVTEDTSAGRKCSTTVRGRSTRLTARRFFREGSAELSKSICLWVNLPSATYKQQQQQQQQQHTF